MIGLGITGLGIILTLTSSFVTVPAGCRGVQVRFGKVQEDSLTEGFHVINPLNDVEILSVRVGKDEEKYAAETSDTQSVDIKVILNWRPKAENIATLYRDYGVNYQATLIPPAIRESIKAEIAKYKVTDLIAERPQIHHNVQQALNIWLQKYNIEVLEVGIADIDFSDKYDAAIETKQVQEQAALQKKYELDRTVIEAQMAAAKAKGDADSRIAEAKGTAEAVTLAAKAEAEALQIRGEAQATYNRKVAESLSPLLIQTEYLKKWDGQLPRYTLGNGSSTMLMLPQEK